MSGRDVLLEVEDLKVHFPVDSVWSRLRGAKPVRAVDGVSFSVERGGALGLVGESGCGKTTTGMAILRLLANSSGRVTFDGQDLSALDAAALRPYRRRIQIIFQDAYASLNPRMSIGDGLAEPLVIHDLYPGRRQERGAGAPRHGRPAGSLHPPLSPRAQRRPVTADHLPPGRWPWSPS